MVLPSIPIGFLLLAAAGGVQLAERSAVIDILNVERNYKQVLSMLFNNNIELTRMTVEMVDSIPSDRRNRQHAFNFVKAHYSNDVNVHLKAGPGDAVPLDEFMESKISPARVVLAMYLLTLIHRPVSSPPPEFVMPNGTVSYDICAQMVPKTFLNRCPSPCEPCERYPEIRPDHSNATIRSAAGHGACRFRRNTRRALRSWFFDPAELEQFQKIVDGSDFHFGNTQVANNFDRFLGTIPQVGMAQLSDGYYENMLALAASLGIPMSRQRYERFRKPPSEATEPGFLGLISRLTLLARQFRPRMRNKHCDVAYFCQSSACPLDGILVRSSPSSSSAAAVASSGLMNNDDGITCLWCSR